MEGLSHLDNFYKLLLLYFIMQLNKAIKDRKSVRKFKSTKPDWRDIVEAIESVRYAPMAGDIFSLRFILIDDLDKIAKLASSRGSDQDFVSTAQYIVAVCNNPKNTVSSYGERGKKYLKQQAGAAIQNFLLSIEEKGLATCWIGSFDDKQVKAILGIPNNVDIEAFFPIGYEMGKKLRRRKIELDKILYFNKYKGKKMVVLRNTRA